MAPRKPKLPVIGPVSLRALPAGPNRLCVRFGRGLTGTVTTAMAVSDCLEAVSALGGAALGLTAGTTGATILESNMALRGTQATADVNLMMQKFCTASLSCSGELAAVVAGEVQHPVLSIFEGAPDIPDDDQRRTGQPTQAIVSGAAGDGGDRSSAMPPAESFEQDLLLLQQTETSQELNAALLEEIEQLTQVAGEPSGLQGGAAGVSAPFVADLDPVRQPHYGYTPLGQQSVVAGAAYVAILRLSETRTVPYGGGTDPAALECKVFSASKLVAEYEIPFSRISHFMSLRTFIRDFDGDTAPMLYVYCTDDPCGGVKVVDLLSGALVMTVADEVESTVMCIFAGTNYIAVGRLWQRYIKDAPLRLYDATTGDLVAEQAKGMTVSAVSMNNDESLLVSFVGQTTAPCFTVWAAPDLTKLCQCWVDSPKAATPYSGPDFARGSIEIEGSQLKCFGTRFLGTANGGHEGCIAVWDIPGGPQQTMVKSAGKRDAATAGAVSDSKEEDKEHGRGEPATKRRR